MFSFKKSFSFSFNPIKRFCALLKCMNVRNQIWKKTFFEPKLLERIMFYQLFTTKQTLNQKFWNVSVFERNFNNSNSSNLESKLLEHVRFRTKLLTILQNLNRTFYNASDFEGKFFAENQSSLQKSLEKKTISLDRLTL